MSQKCNGGDFILKKHRGIIVVLAISMCALAAVIVIYMRSYLASLLPKQYPTSATIEAEEETTAIDLSQYQIENRIIELIASSGAVPSSASLDVPFVDQNPELPTGCEITSLTEVLNYYGYNVDKEYMARNYLPMSETAQSGCFIEYYLGSPWKINGSGCFAPAVVTAANNFFMDRKSALKAYSLSYASIDALFEQISLGYPVIVWTSFDYSVEEITYTYIEYETGGSFYWPIYEHCVVLSGYDKEAGTVTFADPTYGIVQHSIEDFEKYYQKFFYQAVVIK
jgi:uncharacterized protein YvpB